MGFGQEMAVARAVVRVEVLKDVAEKHPLALKRDGRRHVIRHQAMAQEF